MRKLLIVLVTIMTCTGAFAQNLSCELNGKKFGISINESKRELKITDANKYKMVFEIYDISSYEVDDGSVVSYRIKNGTDMNGFSISGEVATLNKKKVAMSLFNDSLAKRYLTIDGVDCK